MIYKNTCPQCRNDIHEREDEDGGNGMDSNKEWGVSAFLAHCFFTILYRLKEECGQTEESPNFAIWYATFAPFEARFADFTQEKQTPIGLRILPAENDGGFFKEIIENELTRLSALPINGELPCGHIVHEHKDALAEWRAENLIT